MSNTQKSRIFGTTKINASPSHEQQKSFAGYDLIGNIAIVKFPRKTPKKEKMLVSKNLLKQHAQLKTILEKSQKFSGRLRTQKTRYLVGEKTKEALYKENDCEFRLNVDACYFSPRLSSERKELANQVRNNELILVMFGGVAPFAVVIAKLANPKKVISVEISRACTKYAEENVKRNKLSNVKIIQGDVRKKVPQLEIRFDRIVMARPNLKDSFLNVAFKKIKRGGIIHYYGFYDENKVSALRNLILEEARVARKKIKILRIKKAGDVGVRKFRYRADVRVS